MNKTLLYCFPYAGGSSTVFNRWKTYLNSNIELVTVELAGRGRRINEPFHESLNNAVQNIYESIRYNIDKFPYIFFGHSMGSLIAYELCQKIIKEGGKEPVHLFVSGRQPPQILREKKMIHKLPLEQFKDEIFKIGGTPKEIFEDESLLNIFLPILKADYKMVEEYQYIESSNKLTCNISIFNGKDDEATTYENMVKWKNLTIGNSQVYEFEGGHFFINNHMKRITEIINDTIIEDGKV